MGIEELDGISIVIPVYNVENYLEKCLQSVCNQSAKDYEIILVNDGSTDNSGKICEDWSRKDRRIKYYIKDNEGLGPTRDYGMKKSNRKYVTFIDSDDWIAENFVESMLKKMVSSDYDIVYCDCCYVNELTKDKYIDRFRKNLDAVNADMNIRLAFGYPNIWAALYRKGLWIENDIHMPGIVYEDTAIYGVLLSKAEKIGYCSETLYYYRTSRPGSLMQIGMKDYSFMVKSLLHLLELAKEKNVLEKNKVAFLYFCIRQINGDWMKLIRENDIERQEMLKRDMYLIFEKYFDNWKDLSMQNIFAVGSYSSSAVYNKIKAFRNLKEGKMQYISMINFLSSPLDESLFEVKDGAKSFQREMLYKELTSPIINELKKYKVIIFDFLDEQFDILKVNNSYINSSIAYNDTLNIKCDVNIINRDSEQCFKLWKEGFNKFFQFAKQNHIKLILQKLFFNEKFGDENKQIFYDNIDEIKNRNEILKKYYKFIERNYSEIITIELPEEFKYTDKYFPYGVRPEHFNDFAYFYLSYLARKEGGKSKVEE